MENRTLQAVQASAHEAESLVAIGLVLVLFVTTAKFDAAGEELANMLGRCHNVIRFGGDVFLHAISLVDGEFGILVDGASEAVVVLTGVDIVGIILGVVNVVFGTVAAESIGGDFKLGGAVAKGHEAKNAEEQTDCFGGNSLDSTDIDGLGVVAKPVAKVDTRDHELAELFAVEGLCHGNGEQRIFNIAVAPCLTAC